VECVYINGGRAQADLDPADILEWKKPTPAHNFYIYMYADIWHVYIRKLIRTTHKKIGMDGNGVTKTDVLLMSATGTAAATKIVTKSNSAVPDCWNVLKANKAKASACPAKGGGGHHRCIKCTYLLN